MIAQLAKLLLDAGWKSRALAAKSDDEVKALRFGDIEVGIKDLNDANDANDVMFNIAGQRIQKMQKGINIINGKKILR